MKTLIGKLVCMLTRKHKRGKFSRFDGTQKVYNCPRCGRETRYTKAPA